MKKYLITYNETEIVTVSEAPQGGVTASGTQMMITTIDNAIIMFEALGFETEKLTSILETEKDGIVSY